MHYLLSSRFLDSFVIVSHINLHLHKHRLWQPLISFILFAVKERLVYHVLLFKDVATSRTLIQPTYPHAYTRTVLFKLFIILILYISHLFSLIPRTIFAVIGTISILAWHPNSIRFNPDLIAPQNRVTEPSKRGSDNHHVYSYVNLRQFSKVLGFKEVKLETWSGCPKNLCTLREV